MGPIETTKVGAAGVAEKFTDEQPKLLQAVVKLVQDMPGGVSGLMKQFQDKGLGEVVSSFTGKGPKKAITPEQILQGFGSEKINALASATGLDAKVIPEKLATILPEVIEKLTPTEKLAGVPSL